MLTAAEKDNALNVLGHTYAPRIDTEDCYAWVAMDPPGTFVPPHRHGEQDEHVYVLAGEYELFIDGEWSTVKAGDSVCWPQGSVHGYRVPEGKEPGYALFWVSPAKELSTLFQELNNIKDPEEVVRLSKVRDIFFAKPDQVPGFFERV